MKILYFSLIKKIFDFPKNNEEETLYFFAISSNFKDAKGYFEELNIEDSDTPFEKIYLLLFIGT